MVHHLHICSAGCCIAQGVCPRGIVFASACHPARAYDTRVVQHLLICSARCCGVHGVRPRGIVSSTVSRPGQARDTLVTHHLLVCSARCCGARGARLQMLWCANASLPAYDTRVVHHLHIWCARWMCIAHCVASEASCSPLRVFRLGDATRVVHTFSICSARCCFAQGVRPRGIVYATACHPRQGERHMSGSPPSMQRKKLRCTRCPPQRHRVRHC